MRFRKAITPILLPHDLDYKVNLVLVLCKATFLLLTEKRLSEPPASGLAWFHASSSRPVCEWKMTPKAVNIIGRIYRRINGHTK